MTQNMQDYNPAIDSPLEHVVDSFGYDATSPFVPHGMALLKFAMLLEALDWHWYHTGQVTEAEVREKVKWAAELMDKKFDITYQRLPQ
jgi:hypothetical protein